MNLLIYTDGGARGNPGPAAVGVVILETHAEDSNTGIRIAAFGKRIGETTNNTAEYTAVIEAYTYLIQQKTQIAGSGIIQGIRFFLDSTLVVNQLNGTFKVKLPHLRVLLLQVRNLESYFACEITYTSVPRERNREADLLVNQALDDHES